MIRGKPRTTGHGNMARGLWTKSPSAPRLKRDRNAAKPSTKFGEHGMGRMLKKGPKPLQTRARAIKSLVLRQAETAKTMFGEV